MAFNKLVYIQLHLYNRWQMNTIQYNPLVSWSFILIVSKEMNILSRLPRLFIRNWAEACYSCGWFYPAANSSFSGRVTSCSCLKSERLDTSCGWFSPDASSSSSGWMQVVADSVPRLTWVPTAGYELQMAKSYSWLYFQ